jgi:uncharacterized membrane protein YhaH (DUF805 family)
VTEFTRASGPEAEASKYWCYALILLIAVSSFFLALRFSGRAFMVADFEILVIYLPTVVCALVYATKIGRMIQR